MDAKKVFRVYVPVFYRDYYDVEAESAEEAKEIVLNGEVSEPSGDTGHVADFGSIGVRELTEGDKQ